MIEIYSGRIEFSNPGQPFISVERFIDEYQSRNDSLADIMRRIGICEEKGSGMDKTIFYVELYQLPPVRFQLQESRTRIIKDALEAKLTKEENSEGGNRHNYIPYWA